MPATVLPFNDLDNPGTTLCVTPGIVGNISFPVGISKTLAAGIDIPGSIGANASGHIFAIYNPTTDTSDILFSASALNPKLPPGFTDFEAINGFITDATGAILAGVWQEGGTFTLDVGLPAKLGIDLTYTHLERLPVPLGCKVRALLNVVAYSTDNGSPGFYVLVKDPDSWPTKGLVGVDIDTTSVFSKTASLNASQPIYVDTDCAGQVFVGAHASVTWTGNRMHLYIKGWQYQQSQGFGMATFGASLTMDRNACNWPVQVARKMQIGKSEHVHAANFGREGNGSNVWIVEGWHTRMAAIRPDVALIDMTADGNPPNASVSQSLANTYTIIDAVRAANPNCGIYLLKMMKMPGDAVFSQLGSIHANLLTVAANRPDVTIIDCYSGAVRPSEWLDQYHPLWSGVSRVIVPAVIAAVSPRIT